MSNPSPFSVVASTDVAGASPAIGTLLNALNSKLNQGFSVLYGRAVPTAVAVYQFVDNAGNNLVLNGNFLLAYAIHGTSLASAGAPSISVGLAATAGGAIVQTLLGGSTIANLNTGYFALAGASDAAGGAGAPYLWSVLNTGGSETYIPNNSNKYLVANVATAAVTAGVLQIMVICLNA